jgi:hypothetical protein
MERGFGEIYLVTVLFFIFERLLRLVTSFCPGLVRAEGYSMHNCTMNGLAEIIITLRTCRENR